MTAIHTRIPTVISDEQRQLQRHNAENDLSFEQVTRQTRHNLSLTRGISPRGPPIPRLPANYAEPSPPRGLDFPATRLQPPSAMSDSPAGLRVGCRDAPSGTRTARFASRGTVRPT
jgi:hypothetical protein